MNSFLHCACQEALLDSGLELSESVKANMGVNIGSMSSSMSRLTECIGEAAVNGFDRINRLTMLHILSNIPTATLTIKYGLKGPSGSVSTACATGLSSVGDAYKWIKYG
jgi:3-oxoacyl-[acyl-carrier-protein] synthase II